MRRRPTQAMADMMRMPIRLAAVFLSWTLSHSVHARCVGEPVQVEVRVTDAGAPVPGAAIKVAWVAAGMASEPVHGAADEAGRFTLTLNRPVTTRSRWPVGTSCRAREADIEVCASAGARDERCSLLHRPAAAAIPVQIELRGG